MAFETNVFINCPFDDSYRLLLMRPLMFTISYLGFSPVFSQTLSSGNVRVQHIKKLIRTSKYAIHDLSRSRYEPQIAEKGQQIVVAGEQLPRFNMPYELGLDAGCCEFGSGRLKQKRFLVLEKESFHYARVLSDIAGQDIVSHNDEPVKMIEGVRNWFSRMSDEKLPGYSEIWIAYNEFLTYLTTTLTGDFSDAEIERMQNADFLKYVKEWKV